MTEAGPYHRFVAVEQATAGYKTTPKQHIPAFAVVSEMRDPESFGRNMETVLRGAALLAKSAGKAENERRKPTRIVKSSATASRRTAPFQADVNDIRFNFSPSFTRVGNQFVISSTTELCRALVDELQKEAKESPGAAAKTQQLRLIPSGVGRSPQGVSRTRW